MLLTHGFAERIGLPAGKQAQGAGLKHHLLLVNRHPVSIFQEWLHHGVVVFNGFLSVLAADKGRDVFHRSRAVEGVHGNEVLEAVGLQGTEVLFHPGGFKLEKPCRLSPGKELEGLRVVQGDFIGIEGEVLGFLDVFQASLDDGKGAQSQKVHFNQADGFHEMPVILGGHQALAFCRHDGNVVCQWVAADEDAAGMYAGLAHGTFEGFGKLDGFGNQWIG